MTTPTIKSIRSARDQVRSSLKNLRPKDYEGSKYGPESEYTVKGLISGTSALLVDISALTKAPTIFIKYSTHAERDLILRVLNAINTDITTANITNLATHVDQLKPLIWRYGIRHTDIRQQNHDECIDNLQKRASELDEKITNLQSTIENSETQVETFENLVEKISTQNLQINELYDEINSSMAEISEEREIIEGFLTKDKDRSEEISELLSNAKSHSGLIENFINRVEKREDQLDKQETATKSYIEKINEFTSERAKLLQDAKDLISSAKIALEYKTAEGLSAAFIEKYNESKNDRTLKYWLIGGGVFVGVALLVGIWILWGNDTDFKVVLGRISLLPMLIAGAWFCSSQYVKQINIREDYGYKSVLSKSIVGFSEQFKGNQNYGDEYSHYIKSVLEEIHKDPLRKRNKASENPSELKEDVKELIKESKLIKDLAKRIPTSTTTIETT